MKVSAQSMPKSRGRPQIRSDEATQTVIHEAARHEFVTNGYAATSMEAVARRAGVSTKTLYRLIPTKESLFEGMVSDRLDLFSSRIGAELIDHPDLASGLEAMLIECGRLVLDGEIIALQRMVIAESGRFPEIAEALYKRGIQRTTAVLSAWLDLQSKRGCIVVENPKLAAGMLLGMMISEPQRAALLGQRRSPGADEISKRARICAQLFLRGSLNREDPK